MIRRMCATLAVAAAALFVSAAPASADVGCALTTCVSATMTASVSSCYWSGNGQYCLVEFYWNVTATGTDPGSASWYASTSAGSESGGCSWITGGCSSGTRTTGAYLWFSCGFRTTFYGYLDAYSDTLISHSYAPASASGSYRPPTC